MFRIIFDMSNFQSSVVQFTYYGANFSLAIAAALINRRLGYKAGVLTGLGLASIAPEVSRRTRSFATRLGHETVAGA